MELPPPAAFAASSAGLTPGGSVLSRSAAAACLRAFDSAGRAAAARALGAAWRRLTDFGSFPSLRALAAFGHAEAAATAAPAPLAGEGAFRPLRPLSTLEPLRALDPSLGPLRPLRSPRPRLAGAPRRFSAVSTTLVEPLPVNSFAGHASLSGPLPVGAVTVRALPALPVHTLSGGAALIAFPKDAAPVARCPARSLLVALSLGAVGAVRPPGASAVGQSPVGAARSRAVGALPRVPAEAGVGAAFRPQGAVTPVAPIRTTGQGVPVGSLPLPAGDSIAAIGTSAGVGSRQAVAIPETIAAALAIEPLAAQQSTFAAGQPAVTTVAGPADGDGVGQHLAAGRAAAATAVLLSPCERPFHAAVTPRAQPAFGAAQFADAEFIPQRTALQVPEPCRRGSHGPIGLVVTAPPAVVRPPVVAPIEVAVVHRIDGADRDAGPDI